ncbi:MAG: hypothetical protein IPH04_10790 [Saprospirales bacterium]|nr:hypothetical protein [Saprospirales bacterium]
MVDDNCGINVNAGTQFPFNYTGTLQSFTVPEVTSIKIETWGGQGGNEITGQYTGGLGAYISGNVTVSPGDQLIILVGGQGEA